MNSVSESYLPITAQLVFSTNQFVYQLDILSRLRYIETVQYSDAYRQALAGMLEAAKTDLSHLEQLRTILQAQIDEADASIAVRRQEIEQFTDMWQRATTEEKADDDPLPLKNEKSFTNAITWVLKKANRGLSPKEITNLLTELGYDTSNYTTDVVSSVHTILKRFLAADPPKVTETGEPRRRVYRWIWEAGRTPEAD
jgi:hypothetical protein